VGVRILHTSDWQLGIVRHSLGPVAQARWDGDRLGAIRRLLEIAGQRGCACVVVAGDVVEHPLVSDRVVHELLGVLRESPVPVLLLPGNHDPLGPGSIWEERLRPEVMPPQVTVLDRAGLWEPVEGVEVLAAPYPAKQPPPDLLVRAVADVGPPDPGVVRVLVAHGQVEQYGGEAPLVDAGLLERWVHEGLVHYVALGDHHSTRQVGASGRIWYSGTPEATRPTEADPGAALVVEVTPGGPVQVEQVRVGQWRFARQRVELSSEDDVVALRAQLESVPRRDRVVLELELVGQLPAAARQELEGLLDPGSPNALVHGFAACQVDDRGLVTTAGPTDWEELGLRGYAAVAAAELAELAQGQGPEARCAGDALGLLQRLVREDQGGVP